MSLMTHPSTSRIKTFNTNDFRNLRDLVKSTQIMDTTQCQNICSPDDIFYRRSDEETDLESYSNVLIDNDEKKVNNNMFSLKHPINNNFYFSATLIGDSDITFIVCYDDMPPKHHPFPNPLSKPPPPYTPDSTFQHVRLMLQNIRTNLSAFFLNIIGLFPPWCSDPHPLQTTHVPASFVQTKCLVRLSYSKKMNRSCYPQMKLLMSTVVNT